MEEEQIMNLGGVIPQIPTPSINPGNQIPGSLPSPKEAFAQLMAKNQSKNVQNIPVSSFYHGGNRYSETRPFTDFEEMAGQQQSAFDQAFNGVTKGVGIAATSFISGTVGLLNGMGSAIANQQFSKLWDNPTTRLMDDLQKRMEDYLPNYYTQRERDSEWWEADNLLTPNFWADKVIKNIGYGLGSIGGGMAWSKAFKLIGQATKLAKAGQSAQAAVAMEKAMQVVPRTQKVSAIENTLSSLSQKVQSQITNNGNRFLTSAMGTFGEASIESLQKANEFRENAIAEYRKQNGVDPTGEDLNEINSYAEKIGNYVWGMNTILLSATNYVQLPKIFGSSRKVEKAFINDLTQKGLGKEFIEDIPKTALGRISSTVLGGLSRMLPESFEEGMQFAIATGVDDFFNRAYANREDLDTFLNTAYKAMGNVFGEGIEKTLNTKEGIESILIGGLAGGIQQAPMSIIQGGISGRGGQKGKNTKIALAELNATNIQDTLKTQADFLAAGIGSQALRTRAIQNNDILSEKDYERDYALSYLMPRARYGKMDSVYNEIDMYKQQAMTAEGFSELQSAGIAFPNENPSQFTQRLNSLENVANAVQKHYDNINESYAGIFQTDENGEIVRDKKGNALRKYNPVVIDKLVYAASKIDDYNVRIPEVNNSLMNAGIMTSPILQDILENKKPNGEAVKEALDKINSMDVVDDTKDNLKRDLSDLIELSLRRKLFIDQYNKIKKEPEFFSVFSPAEKLREMGTVEVAQKEDGKKVSKPFQIGKEYALSDIITVENDKLVLSPKVTILSETLGGEFEVRLPDGREVYMSPLEMSRYTMTEESNESPEFEEALNQAIDETLNPPEFEDISVPVGVSKLDFINSLRNKKLLNAIVDKFNELAKVVIKKRKDIKKAEDEIKKNKNKIKKQINDFTPKDDVETFPPTLEELTKKAKDDTGELGFLPSADEFFIRITTASEDPSSPTYDPNPAPHIVRSRIFLNNVENFSNRGNIRAIPFTIKQSETVPGLESIIRLSYNLTDEQYNALSDKEKKEFDNKIKNVQTGFVGMVFVEQDPSTKEMFYVDQEGKRINKLGEQVDLSRVIFQTMPTTEVKYSDGSDRYRGGEKDQFLANAVAWGAVRDKMFKDPSMNAYKFYVSRGIPLTDYNEEEERFNEFAVGDGHLATNDEIYSMKGLLEVVVKGFVAFQGKSLKMRKGTTVLKNKDKLVYLNNTKFGRKKAESIYRVMKALVDEMIDSGKSGKEITLNKQYMAFLSNVLFYKEGDVKSKSRFYIDLDNLTFVIGSESYPIKNFATYEQLIINQLTDTYHSVSKGTLTKSFEDPFYEFYYENGELKEREWFNYQTYLLSGKDRNIDEIPLVSNVVKPSEANPTSFLSKYAVLMDFDLGAQKVKTKKGTDKNPKLPKDKKDRKGKTTTEKLSTEIDYSGEVINENFPFATGKVDFLAIKNQNGNVKVSIIDNEKVGQIIASVSDSDFEKIKSAAIADGYVDASETNKTDILIAFFNLQLGKKIEALEQEKEEEEVDEEDEDKSEREKALDEYLDNTDHKPSSLEMVVSKSGIDKYTVVEAAKNAAEASEGNYTFGSIIHTMKVTGGDINYPNITLPEKKRINLYNQELAKLTGEIKSEETKTAEKKTPPLSGNSFTINKSFPWFREVSIIKTSDSYESVSNLFKKLRSIKDGRKVILVNDKPFIIQSFLTSYDSITLVPLRESTGSGYTGAGAPQTFRIKKRLAGEEYPLEGEYQIDTFIVSQNISEKWPQSTKIEITDISEDDYYKKSETKTPSLSKLTEFKSIGEVFDLILLGTSKTDSTNVSFDDVQGFVVNFSGVDAKDDIKLYIKSIEKEGDNYRVIGRGGKGARAGSYNFLVNDEGYVEEITSAKGKTFSGETYTSLLYSDKSEEPNVLRRLKEIKSGSPPSGKTFDKEDDDVPFREIGSLDVERITPDDIIEFKKWHAEKVPFIPYEILEQIYKSANGVRAWGALENKVAKFYKGAERGTEYHEIFEAIWEYFLTPAERESIIKDLRNKGGYFVDRKTKKEILYLDATDKEIKERIADDFADFRLGKLPARSLSESIRRFFKAIIDFFTSFVRKPTLKDELFKAIEAGKFKESRIPETAKVIAPQYRAIPDIDETTANLIVEDMIAETAMFLFKEDKSLLYNPKEITGTEVYRNIVDVYSKPGNNRLEVIGEEAFDLLYERMRGFFYSLGVNIPVEESVEINEGEATNRNYAAEPFETDWKKNARFAIKFAIATMIKRNADGKADLSSANLKGNTLKGYQLLPFGKTFSDFLKNLSNSTIQEFSQKIIKRSSDSLTYKALINRLGGDSSKGLFPFTTFSKDDWRFYIQFFQAFAKQKPEIIVQYMDGGLVYSVEADTFSSVDVLVKDWINSMKQLSKDKSSVIKYDRKTKTYNINTKAKDYPKAVPKTGPEQIEYLSLLGIEFPEDVYKALKSVREKGQTKSDKDQFAEAVSTMYTYIAENKDLGSLTTTTLNISSSFMTLAKLYTKATAVQETNILTNVKGRLMQKYSDNNYTSVFENEFNSSSTLDELIEKFSQLRDKYSTNSVILKKGGRFFDPSGKKTKDVKVMVIQGSRNLQEEKGSEISELGIGQRFSMEINQNLKGNYYIMVPADSSTEWMIRLGNEILFVDASTDRGWRKLYSIFEGYLKDEIAIALDYANREELQNTKKVATELRMFKDILPADVVQKVHEKIKENLPVDEIFKYVIDQKDKNNLSIFQLAIKGMIQSDVNDTFSILRNNGQLIPLPVEEGKEQRYSWPSLELSDQAKIETRDYDKSNLSETQVKDILTFANMNYAISNIEMHKILFGDPYQFKSAEDATKRYKSFLSPRRTTFDSDELNNMLNEEGNIVNGVKIPVGDMFNYVFKDHTTTVTSSDVEIFSKAFPGVEINETDGFSIITDGTFREVKIKNAEWTDQAESWFQWNQAYARQKLSDKKIYTYSSEALRKVDEKILEKPEPDYKLEVLKPIVSGVKYNSDRIELVLDKMSQMPIFYKAVEGTAMEQLYIKMLQKKIGYVAYESARKVGVRSKHNLYNSETKSFNKADFNDLTIEKVSWKSYGIQVSNIYEEDKFQTRGSQITKLVSIDMFVNGKEVMKGAGSLYEKNVQMLYELHKNAYNTLLDKLGITDTGLGYEIPDMVSVAGLLTSEILKRDPSENLRDSLELVNGQFRLRLEASTDYRKIKDILYSLIHKSIISPSMNGRPHVQVPATLWENQAEGRQLIRKIGEKWVTLTRAEYEKLSDEDKKGVRLSSSNLKFYTPEEPYIEVLIPYFFKENLVGKNKKFKNDEALLKYLNDTEEGKSILTGVGFRIPTQAMSSTEVFKVKGFLDPAMGYTVVVPSEITYKAGSDFDIDKLNMYLKSIYIDKDGNPRLVKYKGSEEATRDFYDNVYQTTVFSKIDKLFKSDKSRAKILELFSYGYMPGETDPLPISEYLGDMPLELQDYYLKNQEAINNIEQAAFMRKMSQYDYFKDHVDRMEKLKEKYNDDELQEYLKADYVDDMYKKALENEYFDTMVKMIQLPENLKRLLSPVGKAGLDDVAKDIRTLRGENKDVKNKLINRNYLTKIRQAFVAGKKWVGIAAVNITGHSLAQKANLFLDSRLIDTLDNYTKSFLDVKIVNGEKVFSLSTFLPHNKITVDGEEMISLAGRMTADGSNEFISDRLSGYATGFVDVSKDPFIMDIVRHNGVVGLAMFLERIGAGKTAPYFLNQPIIVEYLRHLDSVEAKGLFSDKNLQAMYRKFPASEDALLEMKGKAERNEMDMSINHLRNNISEYTLKGNKTSALFNAEQRTIFKEFLKLAKMSQQVFSFTQGYNYDTTKFRNADSFTRKLSRTEKARKNNIINSIDNLFENTFIGEQKNFVDKLMNAMGEVFKLEHPDFKYIVDNVMEGYREDDYISQDDYDRIVDKANASFFDFIVHTDLGIQNELADLTVGENSVASQLPLIQKKHPNVKLLSELAIESSLRPNGAETIKFKVKPDLSTEINSYIGMMRELKQLEPEFYSRLVKLAIIQGSYPSYVSILQIVPNEDYAEIVNPIIETIKPTSALDVFHKEAMFQRQNWRDNDIVPTVEKVWYKEKEYNDDYEYSTEIFGSIPGEPVNRRQILLLNPTYNISDDVVKIPRVVKATVRRYKKTPEGKEAYNKTVLIDIKTNQVVDPNDIRVNRAKGLFSYDVYYGYKKVRYSNGDPLVDKNGNHVYKKINLYGDGALASEYRLDKQASVFNNGTSPATYSYDKKVNVRKPDGTIVKEVVKEYVQELEDAQIIAAYGDNVTEEQVAEKTIAASIPQNKVSGVESYGSLVIAADEVIKALGSNPHSIDMITAGFRTRTTRSEKEMAKYDIKVGDIIKHFGQSADGSIKTVYAKVTAIHPKGSPGWKGTWNKEGWRAQDVNVIDRFKDGAAAIEFEVIESPTSMGKPSTGKVEFEKLPTKSLTLTMTYAGIGSRETPENILSQMTEIAKELEQKGYTLNTGKTFKGKEEGADAAFSKGAKNKNLFTPEKHGSRTREQNIAKEIHPKPDALVKVENGVRKDGALKLMARNSNQIFGDNLDTPVDFVLFWAKETDNPLRPEGGTGQAVEMARRKGIPTINMADPNWRQELDKVLSKQPSQLSLPATQGAQQPIQTRESFVQQTLDRAFEKAFPEQIGNLDDYYYLDLPSGLSKSQLTDMMEDDGYQQYEKQILTLEDFKRAQEIEKEYPTAVYDQFGEASTEGIREFIEEVSTILYLGNENTEGKSFESFISEYERGEISEQYKELAEERLRELGLWKLVGYNPNQLSLFDAPDQLTKNRIDMESEYYNGTMKISVMPNGAKYFVLSDNRILNPDGSESVIDSDTKEMILDKAVKHSTSCK